MWKKFEESELVGNDNEAIERLVKSQNVIVSRYNVIREEILKFLQTEIEKGRNEIEALMNNRMGGEESYENNRKHLKTLEDKEKLLSDFSGGEQTKIAMVRLLLEKSDILLLDEPTNHLDMESVRWLENYLQNYSGAVVMVSHDRYFIDETAEIVYELTDKKLVRYVGNYTQFRQQKRKNLAIWK